MVLKKRQFLLLAINVIFIAAVAAIAFYSWLSKPDSTLIRGTQAAVESVTPIYNIDLTPISQSDSFVSFNRPKGLTLKSSALSSPNSVDDFLYTARDVYSWTLAIDISSVPGGQIGETSAYQYRQANPSQYIKQSEVINGQSVVIFTDNSFSGFDKVAFMSHGNLVATVSLMGDDSSGVSPLSQTFSMILGSWHWL